MTFKKLTLLGLSIIATSMTIFSCASNEESKSTFNESTISQRLKFVNANERIASGERLSTSRMETTDPATITNDPTIIIVEWEEWGRASLDCRGWGLCRATWFPSPTSLTQPTTFTSKDSSPNYSTILEFDNEINQYYIDILLAEEVPADIPVEALTLKIDSDFELNIQQSLGRELTFKTGEYSFNEILGQHGGYRIYLED